MVSFSLASAFVVAVAAVAAIENSHRHGSALVKRAESEKLARRQWGPGAGSGLGGFAGGLASQSTTTTVQSTTVQTVFQQYSSLLSQIQSCQSMFAAGSFQMQTGIQTIQQLAMQFQQSFAQVSSCQVCTGGSGLMQFSSIFRAVFIELQELVVSAQQTFPQQWSSMFSQGFAVAGGTFASFFQTCQQGGLALNRFLPPDMASTCGGLGLSNAQRLLSSQGFK